MGAADIIPGVSGGTIALISGIYEHLVMAISSVGFRQIKSAIILPLVLYSPQKRKPHIEVLKEIQWFFLLALVAGILTGIISMSRIIPYAMEEYPYFTYAFFFGLILISLTIPFRGMEKKPLEFLILLGFAAITFVVVGYSRVSGATLSFVTYEEHEMFARTDNNGRFEINLSLPEQEDSISIAVNDSTGDPLGSFKIYVDAEKKIPEIIDADLRDSGVFIRKYFPADNNSILIQGVLNNEGSSNLPFIFFSGMLAITAMILPGISGAYILVLLGEYRHVLESLHNHDLVVLGTLFAGIAVGIFSFIRLLKFMLTNHHSWTMAALTGIMAGSLRKIWPLAYLESDAHTTEMYAIGVGIAIFGAILVFLLEIVSKKLSDPEPPY